MSNETPLTWGQFKSRVHENALTFATSVLQGTLKQPAMKTVIDGVAAEVAYGIVTVHVPEVRRVLNVKRLTDDTPLAGYPLPPALAGPPVKAGPVVQGSGERVKCDRCNRLYATAAALAQHRADSHG